MTTAVNAGIPVPALSASLAYFDSYRSANLPQNLTQAQRDFFGAHTYERTDKPELGFMHTDWPSLIKEKTGKPSYCLLYTSTFGTHHGLANSILLPHCMNFNLDAISYRYALISRHLGFSKSANDNEAAGALIKSVEEISAKVGLPSRLRDCGIPVLNRAQLDELAFLASTDPAIMFNPKESSAQDIIGIYERAY